MEAGFSPAITLDVIQSLRRSNCDWQQREERDFSTRCDTVALTTVSSTMWAEHLIGYLHICRAQQVKISFIGRPDALVYILTDFSGFRVFRQKQIFKVFQDEAHKQRPTNRK